jgi:hypothetical protein
LQLPDGGKRQRWCLNATAHRQLSNMTLPVTNQPVTS